MFWNIDKILLETLRACGAIGKCKIVPSEAPCTVVSDEKGSLFECRPRTRTTRHGKSQFYVVTPHLA